MIVTKSSQHQHDGRHDGCWIGRRRVRCGYSDTSPPAALGLAAVLAGANPKNLLLAVAGAAAIAQTGIPGGQQAIAYLVFALIGTLGVGIPVGLYFALGARSEKLLAGLKDWMNAHNAVIMSVLCLIIAAKLIGDAISSLRG